MAYLAFYRTFRPTTLSEVVRQEHVVKILKNQIDTGKIGHAYLFCGPRGTGKTSVAKIFARAINCENPQNGSPCGLCETCKSLLEGSNLDITEIDAASNNGVDEMRDLREKVQYPPVAGKYKVYIIDEVHMLTSSAFNAVLKTLEEPPRHAVFILATTEPQKIPATILSRCMRFDFKLIPPKDLEEHIKRVFEKTGKEYEDSAVAAIARAGAGSCRDCLSIADMCASYSQGKLTYDDVNAVLGSADFISVSQIINQILLENAPNALSLVEKTLSSGKGVGVLIKDMLSLLNNIAIIKMCKNAREIVNLPEETFATLQNIAQNADGHKILRVTEVLSKAETDMRYALNGRITLETAVLKCAMPSSDYNIDALIGRIASLEKKIADGATVVINATPVATPTSQPVATNSATQNNNYQQPALQQTAQKETQKQTLQQTAPTQSSKPKLSSFEESENPFLSQEQVAQAPTTVQPTAKPTSNSTTQASLWDNGTASSAKPVQVDKKNIFAKFLRLLRERKVVLLFSLCMDLDNFFEGEKMIFTTKTETIYRALNKDENKNIIATTLSELGVFSHEVRLQQQGENKMDAAIAKLKQNFGDVTIKD